MTSTSVSYHYASLRNCEIVFSFMLDSIVKVATMLFQIVYDGSTL
jgi:hypothetical protein